MRSLASDSEQVVRIGHCTGTHWCLFTKSSDSKRQGEVEREQEIKRASSRGRRYQRTQKRYANRNSGDTKTIFELLKTLLKTRQIRIHTF